MLRAFEHIRDRTLLDDGALLHHCNASAMSETTPKSWVMNSTAMPRRCWMSRNQPRNLRLGGDVECGVGSSATRIDGSSASAIAIMAR